MKITVEQMKAFELCKSVEDVLALAKKENISITADQAKKAFELLRSDDISDEALEKIAGGRYWEGIDKPFMRTGHA